MTDSKAYDGTTTSSATPSVSGLQTGDSVIGKTQTFTSKNVLGTNGSTLQVTAYTVNDSNSGGNYQVTLHTATGTITPATVTASIVGNPTKTYDGNTNATLTAANFSLTGVVMGESITVTKTAGTYNTKDVLTANTITTSLASGDFSPGTLTLLTNYTLPTTAGGGETGGRGTDVVTVNTGGIEFPYPSYLENIVRQIAIRFKRSSGGALRAEVFFIINRDGSVAASSIQLVTRSGVYSFDTEALGAVEAASRSFGPLPPGFTGESLPVTFRFDPRILR